MRLTITLPPGTSQDEILDLQALIQEKNLPEMMVQLEEKPADTRAMDAGEFLPIIQVILSSTVAAAGVKGVFDLVKAHIEYKKQAMIEQKRLEIAQTEASKIVFSGKTENGKEFQIVLNSFDETERTELLDLLNQISQP